MSIASHEWMIFSQIRKELMEVLSRNNVLFLWYSSRCLVVVHVSSCPDMCPHLKVLELVSRSLLAGSPGSVYTLQTFISDPTSWCRPNIILVNLVTMVLQERWCVVILRGDLLIKKAPKLLWEQVFCIQNSFGPLYWAIPIAKAPRQNFRHILRPRATCR